MNDSTLFPMRQRHDKLRRQWNDGLSLMNIASSFQSSLMSVSIRLSHNTAGVEW